MLTGTSLETFHTRARADEALPLSCPHSQADELGESGPASPTSLDPSGGPMGMRQVGAAQAEQGLLHCSVPVRITSGRLGAGSQGPGKGGEGSGPWALCTFPARLQWPGEVSQPARQLLSALPLSYSLSGSVFSLVSVMQLKSI